MIPSWVLGAEQKAWSVNSAGNITWISTFDSYAGGVYQVSPSLTPSGGAHTTCGSSGIGTFTGGEYLGNNVFTDGGLGTNPVGPVDCTVAGTYYLLFTDTPPSTVVRYYYPIYYNGSSITPTTLSTVDTTTVTRFTGLSITGTSSVVFDAYYFLEQSEIDTAVSAKNPSLVTYGTSLRPSSSVSTIGFEINETAQGYGTSTAPFGTTTDGVYDLVVRFGNLASLFGAQVPFENAYVYSSFTISGGVLVATGTTEIYNGYTAPSHESYQYEDCGITSLDSCINNAFVFLFIPNQEYVQENYMAYQSALETNAPFSYIYDVNALWSNFSSTTGSTTKPEVPFTLIQGVEMDLMASSTNSVPDSVRLGLRTIAGAFMWAFLAFAMWHDKSKIFS